MHDNFNDDEKIKKMMSAKINVNELKRAKQLKRHEIHQFNDRVCFCR